MSEIKISILKALKSTIVPIALTTSSLAMGHASANVIINEVDADQTSTDNAEFIELYDGGVGLTDLSGLSLVLYNGSDNKSYLAYDLDGYQTNEFSLSDPFDIFAAPVDLVVEISGKPGTTVTAVPEPSTFILFALTIMAFGVYRVKKSS